MPHVGPELTLPFLVGEGEAAGTRLIGKLEPWLTTDLERFLLAAGALLDPILTLAEEEGEDGTEGYVPAWGKLFDVTRVPAIDLGYLGQYVGTAIPVTATEVEGRALIEKHPNTQRGTPESIEEAIRKSLTGAKAFKVLERHATNGSEDAYHFTILIFNAGEMPSEAALIQAVTEVKPAGVFFNISVGSLTYAVLEASHAKYSLVEAAHTKYTDTESEPSK